MEVVEAIQRCNILKIALASVNVKRKTAYQALKPQQTRTLLASIQNDVLSILPTGYGKSLIFECLPRVVSLSRKLPSAIILVSPLNSIILEQVSRYNDLAIEVTEQFLNNLKIHHSLCSSTTINSNNCSCQGVLKQFTTGTFMFLIGHPEQMIHKDLFKELRHDRYQTLLTHLVIDEAHCVEKWGKDFRKDFSKLRELRSILPKAKVLALTGTASTETQKSIKVAMLMKDAVTFQSCIARTNIKLFVKRRPNYKDGSEESFLVTIKPFVEELKEKKDSFPKTVIYCNLKWCGAGYEECQRHLTIDDTKQLVAQYHAPCTNQMKDYVVQSMGEFGKTRLLFATEAYSMGTDTPNIRRIIHFGVPKSVESYMQEVGRAGRDGAYAEAILFYNNNDVAKNVVGLDTKMSDFCRTDECRWNFLCNHFGCPQEISFRDHMCCDNCVHKCSCPECSDDRLMGSQDCDLPMAVSASKLLCIKQSLLQYFQAENSISTHQNPVLHTGLSIELADRVAKCVQQGRDLKNYLSYLNSNYIGNITAIVQAHSN